MTNKTCICGWSGSFELFPAHLCSLKYGRNEVPLELSTKSYDAPKGLMGWRGPYKPQEVVLVPPVLPTKVIEPYSGTCEFCGKIWHGRSKVQVCCSSHCAQQLRNHNRSKYKLGDRVLVISHADEKLGKLPGVITEVGPSRHCTIESFCVELDRGTVYYAHITELQVIP